MSLFGLTKSSLAHYAKIFKQAADSGEEMIATEEVGISCPVTLTTSLADFNDPEHKRSQHRGGIAQMQVEGNQDKGVDLDQLNSDIQEFIGYVLSYAAEGAMQVAPQIALSFSRGEDEPGVIYLDLDKGKVSDIPFTVMGEKIDEFQDLLLGDWKDYGKDGLKIKKFVSEEEKNYVLDGLGLLATAHGLEKKCYENVFDTDQNAILANPEFLDKLRANESYIERM